MKISSNTLTVFKHGAWRNWNVCFFCSLVVTYLCLEAPGLSSAASYG